VGFGGLWGVIVDEVSSAIHIT